jgi:hypothetical protein
MRSWTLLARGGFLPSLLVIFSLCACSKNYLNKEDLISAFKDSPDSTKILKTEKIGYYRMVRQGKEDVILVRDNNIEFVYNSIDTKGMVTLYHIRSGQEINAVNDKKEVVKVRISERTGLFINKGQENQFNAYFSSSWLMDDIIYGYESRILKLTNKINVNDITKVEFD